MKFYATDEELERLKLLAELRFMNVAQYCKLTSLGVKIQQAKPIAVQQTAQLELSEDDQLLLKELLEKSNQADYISYSKEFNARLIQFAKKHTSTSL